MILIPVSLLRVSDAGFGISYNLGHGGYASFSLPSGHSHPPLHVVTPSPVQPAVPLFLNNPLYQAPAPAYTPPVVPSNLYQTHFNTPVVAPVGAPVVTPPPTFAPSRPDKIPPHLHPALNPTGLKPFPPFSPPQAAVHQPHLQPHHQPQYTPPYTPPLPYTPPVVQYDPFEFQKTENETDSPGGSPNNFPPFSPAPAGSFPPVNSPPPPPVTAFPPVSLQPLPSPVAPPLLPTPDDFPEYDAVPANLGPLIPGFIPVRQTLQPTASHPLLVPRAGKEDPSQFLFTANRGFGLPTSDRLKRKNEKVTKIGNMW